MQSSMQLHISDTEETQARMSEIIDKSVLQ